MADFFIATNLFPMSVGQETNTFNNQADSQKTDDEFSQILVSFFVLPTTNNVETSPVDLEADKNLIENITSQTVDKDETKASLTPISFLTNNVNTYETFVQGQEIALPKENLPVETPSLQPINSATDIRVNTANIISNNSATNATNTTNPINTTNENTLFNSQQDITFKLTENNSKVKEQNSNVQNAQNIPVGNSLPFSTEVTNKEISKDIVNLSYQPAKPIELSDATQNTQLTAQSLTQEAISLPKKKSETPIFTEVIKKLNNVEKNLSDNFLKNNLTNVSSTEHPLAEQTINPTEVSFKLVTENNGVVQNNLLRENKEKDVEYKSENIDNLQTTSTQLETIENGVKFSSNKEGVGVLSQVSTAILTSAKNVTDKQPVSLQLTLFPKELGKVEIKMVRSSKGVLSTNITVSSDQAYGALSSGLSQLRDSLEQAGVFIDQLGIQNNLDSGGEQNFGGGNKNSERENSFAINNFLDNENSLTENTTPSLIKQILSLHI